MAEFGFVSDDTLKEAVEAQKATNTILQVMMAESLASISTDAQSIKHIVQQGNASTIFSVGDQIVYDWEESVSGNTYSMPHNVVKFEDVELSDGDGVPGMWLQTNYASALGIPFDAREAFYYAAEGLSAGAYSFTFGVSYGECKENEAYYFTLTNDVPAGGQLVFESDLNSESPSGTNVLVYAAPEVGEDGDTSALTTILESAAMSATAISGAIDLGTIGTESGEALNGLRRAVHGYNRWSQSAIRQYLNSSAGVGEWWSAQNNFDRPPEELFKYPGYMSGYDSEFLSAIQKVKVTTVINSVDSGSSEVTSEDTFDYFFLPSLEQMYIEPYTAGVEGDYFPYWKRAVGSSSPAERGVEGAFPHIYAVNNPTSATAVRLRTATYTQTNLVWFISTKGTVNQNSYASGAYKVTPVCVIC